MADTPRTPIKRHREDTERMSPSELHSPLKTSPLKTSPLKTSPLKLLPKLTISSSVNPEDQIDEYIRRFNMPLKMSIPADIVKTIKLTYGFMNKINNDLKMGTAIIEPDDPITMQIENMEFTTLEPVTEKTQNSYLDTNPLHFETQILQNETNNVILKKYIVEEYNYVDVYLIALHEITLQSLCLFLKSTSNVASFSQIIIPKIYKVTIEIDGTTTYINIYMEKLIAIPKTSVKYYVQRYYDAFNPLITNFFLYLETHGIYHLDTKYQNVFFINYNGVDAVAVIDFGTARVYPIDHRLPGANDGFYLDMTINDFSKWIDGRRQNRTRTFGGSKTKIKKRKHRNSKTKKRKSNKRKNQNLN